MRKRRQYMVQIGMIASALEHSTPEKMFVSQDPNDPGPDAISAAKALQKASEAGQRIYHITQSNMSSALPNIRHDSATMAEIRAGLHAGKAVITHVEAVSVPGLTGAGYIILDQEIRDGAYKISGGQNGGGLKSLRKAKAFLITALKRHPIATVIQGLLDIITIVEIVVDCLSKGLSLADFVKAAVAIIIVMSYFALFLALLTSPIFWSSSAWWGPIFSILFTNLVQSQFMSGFRC